MYLINSANQPAPAIDALFRTRLQRIFGKNPFGGPMIRVVWGQEVRQFFHEQQRIKYPANARRDIGIPRWFIEQWIGPNVACQNWEEERYEWRYDPKTGIHRKVDMNGPPPLQGMYGDALYCIAEHAGDGHCCRDRRKRGYLCYGRYRDPDLRDIEYIGKLKAALDSEPYLYGYDDLPPREVLEQDARDFRYIQAQREAAEEARLREALADSIRPHTARLFEPGGRLDKEKYKDFGPAIKKLREQKDAP